MNESTCKSNPNRGLYSFRFLSLSLNNFCMCMGVGCITAIHLFGNVIIYRALLEASSDLVTSIKKKLNRMAEHRQFQPPTWAKKHGERQRNEKRISNYLVLSLVLCYIASWHSFSFLFSLSLSSFLFLAWEWRFAPYGVFIFSCISIAELHFIPIFLCFFFFLVSFVRALRWNSSHFQVRYML